MVDTLEVSRFLRDRVIQTIEDLDNFLRGFLDVYLAKTPLVPGNSSPLDFVWDVYKTCLHDIDNPNYNILAMSARGAQKTLSVATLETLLLMHDKNRDVFHMASIYDQSLVAYNYVRGFLNNPFIRETLLEDPKKGRTVNRYGRILQIGTGTIQSVNCLAGDQFISTSFGHCKIDELYSGKKSIKETVNLYNLYNPYYLNNTPITKITYQGTSKFKIIEFDDGSEISVTGRHKCLTATFENEDIVRHKVQARDVKVNDFMIFGVGHDEINCDKSDEESFYCIGSGYECRDDQGMSPTVMMGSPNERWAFVAGYYDRHGENFIVDKNVGKSISDKIVFHSNSKRLLQGLQILLNDFNIGSKIRGKCNRGSYCLSLTYGKNIFIDKIKKSKCKKMIMIDTVMDDQERRIPRGFLKNSQYNKKIANLFNNIRIKQIVDIREGEGEVYDLYSPVDNIVSVGGCFTYQSFHGSVIQDEIDLTDSSVFKESRGMLSAYKGKLPINVCISSRKFAFGNVQDLLNVANKDGSSLKIHTWGILEITRKCSEERSGVNRIPIYVDENDLMAITEKEYISTLSEDKKDYVKYTGYEGCIRCGIFSFCKGYLKKQDADNEFLQPIELTKTLFENDVIEFFKSQRLNMKPSNIGLVYPQWSNEIHRKNHNELWEIITSNMVPNGVYKDRKDIIRLLINMGASACIAIDFGFRTAHALLLFFDKRGRVYVVDEIVVYTKTDLEFGLSIKEVWGNLPIEACYPDPADPGAIKVLGNTLGFYMNNKVNKNKDDGYNTVRNLLRQPGTGDVSLYVASDVPVLSEQMASMHHKIDKKTNQPTDIVAKIKDHGPDCLRYACHTRLGKAKASLISNQSSRLSSNTAFYNPKNPVVAPNARQLADYIGNDKYIDNKDKSKNKVRRKIFY